MQLISLKSRKQTVACVCWRKIMFGRRPDGVRIKAIDVIDEASSKVRLKFCTLCP